MFYSEKVLKTTTWIDVYLWKAIGTDAELWKGCECLQNDVLVKIGLVMDTLENSSRWNKLCFGFFSTRSNKFHIKILLYWIIHMFLITFFQLVATSAKIWLLWFPVLFLPMPLHAKFMLGGCLDFQFYSYVCYCMLSSV